MRHAQYDIVGAECKQDRVTIEDVGDHSHCLTVTNDAEYVVQELLRTGQLKVGLRLFYYDSAGELDEIVFNAGGFKSFRPGPR